MINRLKEWINNALVKQKELKILSIAPRFAVFVCAMLCLVYEQ